LWSVPEQYVKILFTAFAASILTTWEIKK
jgi:hypothetical protein